MPYRAGTNGYRNGYPPRKRLEPVCHRLNKKSR